MNRPENRSGYQPRDRVDRGNDLAGATLCLRTRGSRVRYFGTQPFTEGDSVAPGAEEHVVLINMHHIISDRWSLGVMLRELQHFYAALTAGVRQPLPDLPIQYADYVCWQRKLDMTGDLQYWMQALAGYEEDLTLPYDHPRPPTRAWRAGSLRRQYPGRLTQQLARLGRTQGATLFMSLLAGFLIILHRYTGRRDLVVGTTTAGRESAELEPLIGFFVNIVPLRIDLRGDPTGCELIERVATVTLDGLERRR